MTTLTIQRPTLAPGWYEGMSMADYLAIQAMSASGIELIRRSPAHFIDAQRNPKDETPAMKEGTALHLALLEPHLFVDRYISLGRCEAIKKTDNQRCSNQGSIYRDGCSFCGTHDPFKGEPMDAGIEVMSAEALTRIEGMRASVMAHPDASQFFRGKGCSELVGVWIDRATGVLCKIRLDRKIDRAEHIHADIKTTNDASLKAFTRRVGQLGYHRKAAWYRRGMAELDRPANASVLIAVENPRPHGCVTYLLDETDIKVAGQEIDGCLATYRECLDTGKWSGYTTGLRHLKVAPWDLPEQQKARNEWDEAEDFEEEEVGV